MNILFQFLGAVGFTLVVFICISIMSELTAILWRAHVKLGRRNRESGLAHLVLSIQNLLERAFN